jgi:dynein heavy chain
MFNHAEFSMLLQTSLDHIDSKGFHRPNWINDENAWKFIINLENKIPDFKGIISSFTHNNLDWHKWYISKDIEKDILPVEWDQKCKGKKSVRKLLFIKALRPDKFSTVLKQYINSNLGLELKDTPINLKDILTKEVNNYTPLLIIHENGIDPSESLQKLWEGEEKKEEENKEKPGHREEKRGDSLINSTFKDDKEKKEKKFYISTLNTDNLNHTFFELQENSKIGGWVYLANTHLNLQSIPHLEKVLDDLRDVHKDFRLIISTYPHQKYPISFLQRCEKITFEMPKGIGTNVSRLLLDLQKENPKFDNNDRNDKSDFKFSSFCKLVYSLSMFHSILIERRNYKSYGWTQFYDFNNSDFKICFDILKSYMSKFSHNGETFPWKAVQELIAINYGSRFTNEKDLSLLNTYSTTFFNQKVITDKIYNFSSIEPPYLLPDDSLYERFKNSHSSDPVMSNKSEFFMRMNFYREEAKKLPKEDPPELFGLHFNAEISTQIEDNLLLLENIKLLSPDLLTQGKGVSQREELMISKIHNILQKLPPLLNTEAAKRKIIITTADKLLKFDPTQYSLFLEATCYNNLLKIIRSDLHTIESALKGNTILSPKIESIIFQLYEDKVPSNWLGIYLSTKKFTPYIADLIIRIEFFNKWINNGFTTSYFLSYFTNPNGFITSIKQKYSLDNKVSFNRVAIDYKVNNEDDDVKATTKNGYIIKGLFIQGGLWDKKLSVVKDENIQDLNNPMPLIIMTPMIASDHESLGAAILGQNQILSGVNPLLMQSGPIKHTFPVYYIPIRGEYLGKNSYIMDIPLSVYKERDKDGIERSEKEYIAYWIKKGTCLLMSKND